MTYQTNGLKKSAANYPVFATCSSVLTEGTRHTKLGKKAIFPVHAIKVYRKSEGTSPLILHHGIRWRLVINVTFRPICSRWRTQVPISYKPGWTSQSVWTFWRTGEQRNLTQIPAPAQTNYTDNTNTHASLIGPHISVICEARVPPQEHRQNSVLLGSTVGASVILKAPSLSVAVGASIKFHLKSPLFKVV